MVRALVDALPPAEGGRWGDLRLRVISASILAPIALFCMWVGGLPWVGLVVVGALALGMEWAEIIGLRAHGWPGMLLPLSAALAGLEAGTGRVGVALGLVVVFAAAAWWAARRTDAGRSVVTSRTLTSRALTSRALGREATGRWAAGGVLYIGVAVVSLCLVRWLGREVLMLLVLVVWCSDIGAYVVGRLVGGRKLAPSISPGKTWSGAWGGLGVAAVAGGIAAAVAGFPGSVWVGVAAALLAVASQIGDLFESWVKRRFGVKDSGWLIPGHGGVLDRLDGVLAAAPVCVLLVMIVVAGGDWR